MIDSRLHLCWNLVTVIQVAFVVVTSKHFLLNLSSLGTLVGFASMVLAGINIAHGSCTPGMRSLASAKRSRVKLVSPSPSCSSTLARL